MGPTVYEVANYYLANTASVTNKKLQKMVFYAYAWHLTLNNEDVSDLSIRFFDNKFEAWVHGVVYPDLYFKYREYGTSVIPKYTGALYCFSPDEKSVLVQVNDVYGGFDGNQLELINHQESPWILARNGLPWYEPSHAPISDKDIFEFYRKEAKPCPD